MYFVKWNAFLLSISLLITVLDVANSLAMLVRIAVRFTGVRLAKNALFCSPLCLKFAKVFTASVVVPVNDDCIKNQQTAQLLLPLVVVGDFGD